MTMRREAAGGDAIRGVANAPGIDPGQGPRGGTIPNGLAGWRETDSICLSPELSEVERTQTSGCYPIGVGPACLTPILISDNACEC